MILHPLSLSDSLQARRITTTIAIYAPYLYASQLSELIIAPTVPLIWTHRIHRHRDDAMTTLRFFKCSVGKSSGITLRLLGNLWYHVVLFACDSQQRYVSNHRITDPARRAQLGAGVGWN